jgi:hypothetical protein
MDKVTGYRQCFSAWTLERCIHTAVHISLRDYVLVKFVHRGGLAGELCSLLTP